MAGTKISALTAGAALGGTEALPAVQTAATVKITAAQIKTFTSTSPTLVTPVLGVAAGTSLALGGATIGSNALAVQGAANIDGTVTGAMFKNQNNDYRLYGTPGGIALYNGGETSFVYLTTPVTAALQHGASDAASPVAQTIKFQDVVAGTSNTAGVNATIQAPAGTGTGAGGSLIFQVAPAGSSGSAKNAWATAWQINSSGHFVPGTDSAYDIGTSSVKVRTIYANQLVNINGAPVIQHANTDDVRIKNGSSTNPRLGFYTNTNTANGVIETTADGVFTISNGARNDFGLLQFGGTTSSFPALKRSTTSLQAKLADDSAFTAIQGKLTTDTAYTAGDPTTTGYLLVYDSTGTAYRVPALLN